MPINTSIRIGKFQAARRQREPSLEQSLVVRLLARAWRTGSGVEALRCCSGVGPMEVRLSLWSLVWITAGWLAFFVVMSVTAGHGPWLQMAQA